MEIEIRRFQIELGIPFIYVTHNQQEALTMSDNMAIMRLGKMEQVGEKFSLYHDPLSQFVASFLGSANRFEGKVLSVDDGIAKIDFKGKTVAARAHEGLSAGDKTVFYVKSERVKLEKESTEEVLSGKILDKIFKGQYIDYIIDLGSGDELVSSLSTTSSFQSNDSVYASWDPLTADAFPPEELEKKE